MLRDIITLPVALGLLLVICPRQGLTLQCQVGTAVEGTSALGSVSNSSLALTTCPSDGLLYNCHIIEIDATYTILVGVSPVAGN